MAVGSALLWLLFMYATDRLMHVPATVRVINFIALLGIPLFVLYRHLLRPLRELPDRAGLAILIERFNPGSENLLVSSVQLAHQADSSPHGRRIQRIVEQAEERSAQFSAASAIDSRLPVRRALGALSVLLLSGLFAGAQPQMAQIFLKRMLGASEPWPQMTRLSVEIPSLGDRIQVTADETEIQVRASRGSDIPVLVRAEGEIPETVTLHFSGGQRIDLASGGTRLFRSLLRSVQEDKSLHVTGGDDRDGLPRITIQVLQPPEVTNLAWQISPPPYSGLPGRISTESSLEVLQGSELIVHIVPDPVDATGKVRILPDDVALDLVAGTFPEDTVDGPRASLTTGLTADLSMRVSFELEDNTGLPNPNPGLYAVTVLEDRRPELRLASPSRSDLRLVPGATLPIRIRLEDDFGVAAVNWEIRSQASPDEPLARGSLQAALHVTPESQLTGRFRHVVRD